jgi:hypothetical protein
MNAMAGRTSVPNSFVISSRPLGDVSSPIADDESKIQPGDIILSRARTLTMHSIIALGQIYKYQWDTENTFRFWSHPAMIVAVAGQAIISRDGTLMAMPTQTALVQATVNPRGVNFALLQDFRRDYSSRLWIFSPQQFEIGNNRIEAVREAENEAREDIFDWLKSNGLLENIQPNPTKQPIFSPRSPSSRQWTYGLLSLASILVSQLFPNWKFRFFNEGQVTCSGFVAELMERGHYSFDSEIHAFPADVAEKLYQELGVVENKEQDWTGGAARLKQQISADKKLTLENAKKLKLSLRTWSLLAFGVAIAVGAMAFFLKHMTNLSWPVWILIFPIILYFSVVAAPFLVYSFLAYMKTSCVGIPRLMRMLRPIMWRKDSDLE